MATYKTKGIVIKRSNFGEADRLLTVFSENHGKIRAIAKGVRKPLSKIAGHIELFCLTNFLIAEGRNLDIVAGAETIKCYFKLRSNFQPTSLAYFLSEVIDKMTGEDEPHPKIFILIEEVLENLNGEASELLTSYFILNFLAELGYRPELHKCLDCGKTADEYFFSFEVGGLVCGACRNHDLPVSVEAIKIMRLILTHKLAVIIRIKAGKKNIAEVHKLIVSYLKHTHQQEFKSEKFIVK